VEHRSEMHNDAAASAQARDMQCDRRGPQISNGFAGSIARTQMATATYDMFTPWTR